jgi:hypothetical protein
MDKYCQESSKKKRKALLWLVDPHREMKALCTGIVGGSKFGAVKIATATTMMPPPMVWVVAAPGTPSPRRAGQDMPPRGEVGAAGGVVPDVSINDYHLKGISEFDAHTRLVASGKYCVYLCAHSKLFSFYL